MSDSPEALASFYSAPHRKRARANTAKSMIGPGERPQEIYTPEALLAPLRELWDGIALDPCSGPGSIVGATESFYVSKKVRIGKSGKEQIHYTPDPGEQSGLELPWLDRTYSNPPFGELEEWMYKAAYEGMRRGLEVAQLVPVRPHRKWWRAVRRTANQLIWLDPVFFVGYDSGFPAPLAMLYWGSFGKHFGELYEKAGLGECDKIK